MSVVGKQKDGRLIVLPLDQTAVDRLLGKAEGLGRLRAGGSPVPDGFLIAVDASGAERMATLDAVERADILEAYRKLGAGPVAVRSSGRLEDVPGASQRGRFKTILNVIGEDALLDAVIAVRTDGLAVGEHLGVVVQRMIESTSSGVLFTVSPESASEVLIESAWGLGVTAAEGGPVDRFTVDRDTNELAMRTASKPRLVRTLASGGIERIDCPSELRDAPSLSDDEALGLVRLALELERQWGTPLDLEWALEGSRLWILQARAIPGPDTWDLPPAPHADDLWSRWAMADLFPDPLSPFTWSLASEHWSSVRRESYRRFSPHGLNKVTFFRLYDCRLYFNVGAAAQLVRGAGGIPIPPRDIPASVDAAGGSQAAGVAVPGRWLRLPSDLAARISRTRSVRPALRQLDAAPDIARRYRALQIARMSAPDIWRSFLELWSHVVRLDLVEREVDDEVIGAVRDLERLCGRWLGGREAAGDLLRPIDGAADDIAGSLRSLGAGSVGEGDVEVRTEDFLERHGHRGRGELDWARPRWIENPELVEGLLRQALSSPARIPTRPSAEERDRRFTDVLKAMRAERWLPWRRLMFAFVLRRARRLQPLRSMPRDRVMHLFLAGRQLLLELASRLVRDGSLEQADDLFCLTVQEIQRVLSGELSSDEARALAVRRRLQIARAALRPAPELLGPDGAVLEERLPVRGSRSAGQVLLSGRGASPGVAAGPVRLIRQPADATAIALGDVLVIPAGDVGSTLYFPLAAAMVVERGSLLSHAVVLAREYGLPTVVGVLSTSGLENGTWVRVDGSRGTVEVVSEPNREASSTTLD